MIDIGHETDHLEMFARSMLGALADVVGRQGAGDIFNVVETVLSRPERVAIGELLVAARDQGIRHKAIHRQLVRRASDVLDRGLGANLASSSSRQQLQKLSALLHDHLRRNS